MSGEWSYREHPTENGTVFIVRDGDKVVAIVKHRENAAQICRLRQDATRLLFESRQHVLRLKAAREENRMLHSALRRLQEALRKSGPRQMNNAKTELNRVLRKVRTAQGQER